MSDEMKVPAVPKFGVKDMIPTLNGTGFMFAVRDGYAEDWIRYSGHIADPVLEVGCAYGVATIPALEAGARVVALDMERQHLQILESRVRPSLRGNLTCVTATLPDVDFESGRFGAILCSRVLHFMTGEQIDATIAKMAAWLRPGGRLYLVADTPYGIWRKFIPTFEEGKRAGLRWPGMMVGLHNWLPVPGSKKQIEKPAFMNLLDAELLARICSDAGLRVERATFIDRSDFQGPGAMDGRENAGALAIKD
jgi:2-polyprenyl-3-methyl-5-hydroxy-6-metoxy-1,4-benzoquinol methylase